MIANISTDKHWSTAINQYSLISDLFIMLSDHQLSSMILL